MIRRWLQSVLDRAYGPPPPRRRVREPRSHVRVFDHDNGHSPYTITEPVLR